ncbi:AAA domain-containing protein [Neisseria zalophi]|uniref:Uncharacterized protein n=1 Tax=Neisseria zalophi TaxID=640030 RepID=A0A5J6PUH9_9NEIS|nr:AAA domain-containing protein [Neisseria zalophi]QEY26361.1 hypothetical protein D0T92_07365 [Neisseria zalophi]
MSIENIIVDSHTPYSNNPDSQNIYSQDNRIYWKLPRAESNFYNLERLGKNISSVLKKYKQQFPEFDHKDYEEIATEFCEQFFLNDFDVNVFAYFSNLSLKDQSEKKITLAIRIPNHPIFNENLSKNIAITVLGLCLTDKPNPIFTPQSIALTYGKQGPTNYEKESEVLFQKLDEGKFPPRKANNALSSTFLKSLPKFAISAKERLEAWKEFLIFKENLIKHKTQGVRYLKWKFLENSEQLKFDVIFENQQALNSIKKAFSRQNLHTFELKTSSDPYRFILPKNNSNKLDNSFGNFGQLANNGIKIIKNNKHQSHHKEEVSFDLDTAVWAELLVDISEELSYKLSQINEEFIDDKENDKKLEKINNLFKALPETGFLSISLIGDLALIERHRKAVENLIQNENCYAPYLSNYLFDIKNANQPDHIPEITEWENNTLNDKQKSAVQKILAAPDICLIQGPPGTGKTTVIAEACLQFAKRGEKVLLASQAHDALDNALSRLKNHPNLKAIRLSKNNNRISDEGKEFTGENVLAKQYTALKNYVSEKYLLPQQQLQEKIHKLKEWLEPAHFIVDDREKLHIRDKEQQRQLAQTEKQLAELKEEFEQKNKIFNRQQQNNSNLEKLINFLKNGNDSIAQLTLEVPQEIFSLVKKLCNLETIKIEQQYITFNIFMDSHENQMAILQNLYKRWLSIDNAIPQMQADLDRISLGQGKTDIKTVLKLEELKQEIDELAKKIDDDDDDGNLITLWKSKRKECRELEKSINSNNKINNLIGDYYNLFSDKDNFLNGNSDNIKILLQQRLDNIIKIKQDIDSIINNTIVQLNQLIKIENIEKPNDEEIKRQETIVKNIKNELEKIKQQINKKNSEASEWTIKAEFDSSIEFTSLVEEQNLNLNNLQNELNNIQRQNKDFLPLFKQWQDILTDPLQRAKDDWIELEQTYFESCNVVAISCNEDERTLTNNNFDSFDVVIIDEVSKATPLELLLPLMRAPKAILVGDHRQLPPIFNEADGLTFEDEVERNQADKEEEITNVNTDVTKENLRKFEKMVTASLFKELFEQAPESLRERLDIQFRMHPDIMRMINYFYENKLTCGNPDLPRPHNLTFITENNDRLLKKEDHLLWVDTTNDEHGKKYKIEDGVNINRLEARLIAKTLIEIDRQIQIEGKYNKDNRLKIGVVSFYQPQCRLIRDEIRKNVPNKKTWFTAIDVEINTVIRYQGKEKPIILLSLVKNNGRDLHQKFTRGRANIARFEFINVAMSRAQNLLIIFGARNMLENREVKLPKMDEHKIEKTMIYKKMFNYLEYQADTGNLTETQPFFNALQNTMKKLNATKGNNS